MTFSGSEMASGPLEGFSAGAWRITVVLVILLAGLTLAGCYEVKEEVIPASLGEFVPHSCDQVDFESGRKIIFSPPSAGHDYRFRDVSYSGNERQGTFRAMRIKDNIYAVQARYDDESQCQILFYAINADHVQVVDVAEDTDFKTFASLFGVEYHGDELSEGFSGDPKKILAMLQALRGVEFEVQQ